MSRSRDSVLRSMAVARLVRGEDLCAVARDIGLSPQELAHARNRYFAIQHAYLNSIPWRPSSLSALRVIAVVMARGGSKGVPGKNRVIVGGTPLVTRAVEAARRCQYVERVYVSTDDPAIARIARAAGACVPFLRPSVLADDGASIADAGLQMQVYLALEEVVNWDVMVLLVPSTPFRSAKTVERALRALVRRPEAMQVSCVGRRVEAGRRYAITRGDRLAPDPVLAKAESGPLWCQSLAVTASRRGPVLPVTWQDYEVIRGPLVRSLTVPVSVVEALEIDEPEDLQVALRFAGDGASRIVPKRSESEEVSSCRLAGNHLESLGVVVSHPDVPAVDGRSSGRKVLDTLIRSGTTSRVIWIAPARVDAAWARRAGVRCVLPRDGQDPLHCLEEILRESQTSRVVMVSDRFPLLGTSTIRRAVARFHTGGGSPLVATTAADPHPFWLQTETVKGLVRSYPDAPRIGRRQDLPPRVMLTEAVQVFDPARPERPWSARIERLLGFRLPAREALEVRSTVDAVRAEVRIASNQPANRIARA